MRIAVYCGSSRQSPAHHLDVAREVGATIAKRGHQLVYGGGRTGMMGAVAEAALAGGGWVEGVILDAFVAAGHHHTDLDALHVVDDMRARKQGLEVRADAFLALPGGLGTLEELTEILSFRKLALHRRTLVFLNSGRFYDPLLAQLDRGVEDGFDKPAIREFFRVATSPEQAVALCEESDPG